MDLLNVVVLTADLPDENLTTGQVGTVVQLLDAETVLVEFADAAGVTLSLVPIPGSLLEILPSNFLLDVVRVETRPNYALLLEFENGEQRLFEMRPLLEKRPWAPLKNVTLFEQATIDYGTVVWPGNIDIAPETLYDRSIPVKHTHG